MGEMTGSFYIDEWISRHPEYQEQRQVKYISAKLIINTLS